MLLKNSEYKGNSSFDYVVSNAEKVAELTENDRVIELVQLAELTKKYCGFYTVAFFVCGYNKLKLLSKNIPFIVIMLTA